MNFKDLTNDEKYRITSKNVRLPDIRYYLGGLLDILLQEFEKNGRKHITRFREKLGIAYISQKETEGKVCYLHNPEVRADYKYTFTAIDLLDYMYAVLHSFRHRDNPGKHLNGEFPVVSYPRNSEIFWILAEYGKQLRLLHLLEAPVAGHPAVFTEGISNFRIDEIRFELTDDAQCWEGEQAPGKKGKIWINESFCFAGVPAGIWDINAGAIKPAQKWLYDRAGLVLDNFSIRRYILLIEVLIETKRLMQKIDTFNIQ